MENTTKTAEIKLDGGIPVPLKLKTSMQAHFEQSYQNGINPTIGNHKLDVKWSTILPFLDFPNLANQVNIGVGLFYVLAENGTLFSYVITKAERKFVDGEWVIVPIPFKQEGYLMFTINGSLIIPHQSLNNYMDLYRQTVHVRQWPNGSILSLQSLSNHPKVSFFEGNKFYTFINHNINSANINDYDLTIYNGAINFPGITHTTTGVGYSIDLQTPLMVVESLNFPKIDNDFIINTPYLNKALDIGRMCPPECN